MRMVSARSVLLQAFLIVTAAFVVVQDATAHGLVAEGRQGPHSNSLLSHQLQHLRYLEESDEHAGHDHSSHVEESDGHEGHDHSSEGSDGHEGHDHSSTSEGHDDHDSHDEIHSNEEIMAAFRWAGIFHLEPEVYTLTVKAPELGGDSHAGHNHRRRKLEDDHSGHDHSSHADEEDDHSNHNDASHAATGEEYHFLMAFVPVAAEGQEGIEQATDIVWDVSYTENAITMVSDGDTIIPSTESVFELVLEGESTSALYINITQQDDDVNGTLHYVLYLPGNPSQVEGKEHFLVDAQGEEIWPETVKVLQKEESADPREGKEKPWGTVIGATLLVNLVTLSGVIFLVPTLSTAFQNKNLGEAIKGLWTNSAPIMENVENRRVFDMGITAFACGALLATTVFLIIPEAMVLVNTRGEEGGDSHEGHGHRMLQDGHEGHDHGDSSWIFGTCVLAGFLLPMFLASFFPHHHAHEHGHVAVAKEEVAAERTNNQNEGNGGGDAVVDVDELIESQRELTMDTKQPGSDGDEEVSAKDDITRTSGEIQNTSSEEEEVKMDSAIPMTEETEEMQRPEVNVRLVSAIILGDALHNFADGIFIGVGFLICGKSVGWSILASTIYHELAQEVSDFFLLTEHAHLPPFLALALNFASGLSVTLGAVIVLAADVSNFAIGVILSMSAGIYICVSAKECMPTVDRLAVTPFDRLLAFFCFLLGAVPIGLVLLNHEHCEA